MRWQRPPFDIVRAAHAELLVSDLEASRRFYVDLLGFVVTAEEPGALYLRGYEEQVHHSLVLRQLPAAGGPAAGGGPGPARRPEAQAPDGGRHGPISPGGRGEPGAGLTSAPGQVLPGTTQGHVLPAAPPGRGLPDAAEGQVLPAVAPGQALPAAAHLAYRVAGEDDLDRLAAFFQERGCRFTWLEPGDEPGQGRALRVQDPLGFPVEFFCRMERAERLLQRFDRYRGAHILRLDHFNLHVPDVQAAYDHYKALGFRCSEYTATDPPGPDERLWAAWMYRKPNVHDVALMNGDGPRLHHLGFWVSDTQSVLRACDILAAAGWADAIERGPGRHGLSNAFFVYLRDPDGHRIELYTCDYYTGDPDFEPIRWSVNDPRRGTFWGHAAPASWFEESSRVLDLDGRPVPVEPAKLRERPQTVT